MDKILENFGDNRVQSVILYVARLSGDNTWIYEDADLTVKANSDVVKDLYLKGMLVLSTSSMEYLTPVIGQDLGDGFHVYVYLTSSGGGADLWEYIAE